MRLLLEIDWSFFNREYFGERVSAYLSFAGIIIATLLLKKPLAALLTRVSARIAARYSYIRHKDTIGPMLFKPMERLLQIILYFVAINQFSNLLDSISLRHVLGKRGKMNITLEDATDHIFLFLFIIFLTQVISRFIDFIYYLRMGKAQLDKNHSRQQLLPLVKEMSKLLMWVLSIFWILGSVFHVNIPALITGLGIGGVAIALAGKETVENFFAAFTILSDRPFQVGDSIKLGDTEGVVERIGFRSTRLRNTDGSAFIIPNQSLVSQNLVNLSMRNTRGVKVAVPLRYGIEHKDLMQLVDEIKQALHKVSYVTGSVEVNIDSFEKETIQLIVNYHLPFPLPENINLASAKREINMKVYEIASAHNLGSKA
jgi:MscS family membrane protein